MNDGTALAVAGGALVAAAFVAQRTGSAARRAAGGTVGGWHRSAQGWYLRGGDGRTATVTLRSSKPFPVWDVMVTRGGRFVAEWPTNGRDYRSAADAKAAVEEMFAGSTDLYPREFVEGHRLTMHLPKRRARGGRGRR